jgi:ferredoxin/flavodoxin
MRGVICYYSGSGNTKLACAYIAAHLGFECDLIDVIAHPDADLTPYDFAGLAASADFGGLSHAFETFLAALPPQGGKPAFAFNTYGFQNGRTLLDLVEQASGAGFDVIGAHAMRMPESYPPMIALHLAFADQPKAGVVRKLDGFIAEVAAALRGLEGGAASEHAPVRTGWLASVSKAKPRTSARDDMGVKSVDAALCTECGICAKQCPYGAIVLSPKPVFDQSACFGCWRCYNRCPEHAIYTPKFRGGPYYPRPSDQAKAALRATGI